MFYIGRIFVATALCVTLASGAHAQALNAETPPPTSESAQLVTLMAKYASEDDVTVRVNTGQTLTKAVLNVATGKTELAVSLPSIEVLLKRGVAMYKNVSDTAKAAHPNLRSMFAWTGGVSMLLAYDSTGITDWEGLRGKRIFMGPPGSNASRNHAITIELTTGMKANEDYEPVYMGFTEGRNAIKDGLVDAGFVMGAPLSAQNQLMFQNHSTRVIGFSDDHLANPDIAKYLKRPGTVVVPLDAGTFENQSNDAATSLRGFTMNLVTHKDIDEETVYKLTKAFWSNIAEIESASALLDQAVDPAKPLIGVSLPLHPGALRYYQEAGVKIPKRLMPK